MARLSDKQKEQMRNDLILGASQYKVAKDYEVSLATVNKINKTINHDEFLIDEVKQEVAIQSKLFHKSESLVKGFDNKVKDMLRMQNLIHNSTINLILKANEIIENDMVEDKLNVGDGMQRFAPRRLSARDLKDIGDVYDKASLTLGVNARHSNNNITLTANSANVNDNKNMTLEEAQKEALALGVPLEALLK